MTKYRKLPVVISAFRYGYENVPDWLNDDKFVFDKQYDFIIIKTLEGAMKASKGDYIIEGINGEIYPCRADIFEKTYEKVEDE